MSLRRSFVMANVAVATFTSSKLMFSSKTEMQASSSPTSSPPVKITLFQYKICPYCNRVKSLLDFLDIEYTSVEVSPLTKSQLKSTSHKKVPVIKITDDDNETILADSALIVNYFTNPHSKIKSTRKLPKDFIPSDSEKWMEWSDRKLAVMLYPNITRSFKESWECFEYTNDVLEWSYPERKVTHVAGAFFMMLANGKIKKKYGIVKEREELMAVLTEWTEAIGKKPFLHGKNITLPDLMVYGVLKSIAGLQTFNEVMNEKDLREWYKRVEIEIESVKKSSSS